MGRPLSKGMQAALSRTQAIHQDIRELQRERVPVQYVPVAQLRPSPFQARMDFSGLEGLTEDIRQHGVLQPLMARPVGEGLELIAGERRWRAATAAGLAEVPVMVREASDEQARLYGLRENLERTDLNAYELASAALALAGLSLGQTPEQVRARLTVRVPDDEVVGALDEALGVLGKDLTRLSFSKHYLPLLDLPELLRAAIRRGVPWSAVRVLSRGTPEQQAQWLPSVEAGEWGVRDVEEALRAPIAVPKEAGAATLAEETRRVMKLASARRIKQLDPRGQRRLRKLLQEVEALLQEEQEGQPE